MKTEVESEGCSHEPRSAWGHKELAARIRVSKDHPLEPAEEA